MRGTGHRLQHGAPVSAGTSVQGTKFTYIDRTMKVCMASFPHFRNFFVAPRAFLRVSSDFRSFDTRVSFASGRSALWRHTHVAGRYIHATFPRYILRARVARPHERIQNAKMRHCGVTVTLTADRLRRLLHTHQFLNRARFFNRKHLMRGPHTKSARPHAGR